MTSEINFITTQITIFKSGNILGTASGFFFNKNGKKFLITNRHVVIHKDKKHYPDSIKLELHHSNKTDLKHNHKMTINLYNDNGVQNWIEHENYNILQCDVIAIPLNSKVLDYINLSIFNNSSITFVTPESTDIPEINPFADVVVIGYPLGFYDETNNLPVYRKASIASQYGVNFNNKPYFLIDVNLHPGTSGSPVVSTHHSLFKEKGITEGYKVFGIHSAEHIKNGEPLGLNVVWYSYLINEIIDKI